MLTAATAKLFPLHQLNGENEHQVLAAFAARVSLELAETEASSRLAAEAVRSHMRILVEVSRHLLTTECPSEPVLAIAAAETLNKSHEIYTKAFKTLLDKLILQGLVIDRGLQGELCSRLLLTLARDKALGSSSEFIHRDDANSDNYAVKPVQCSEFLKSLLGDKLGLPDTVHEDCERLLAEVEDVLINFTHFVQREETIDTITEKELFLAWSCGFAFQCAFNQPVIDGFLVGYAGNLDEPLKAEDFVLIAWQTKAQAEAADLALATGLTIPFFTTNHDGIRTKLRHVCILMDLGTGSRFGNRHGPRVQLSVGKAVPTNAKEGGTWQGYARNTEQEIERFCLNVRGHRAETYPVLKGFDEEFHQLFERSLSPIPFAFHRSKARLKNAMRLI